MLKAKQLLDLKTGFIGGLALNQGWLVTSSRAILSEGLVFKSLETRSLATPEIPLAILF
jgi:hypothetical protein